MGACLIQKFSREIRLFPNKRTVRLLGNKISDKKLVLRIYSLITEFANGAFLFEFTSVLRRGFAAAAHIFSPRLSPRGRVVCANSRTHSCINRVLPHRDRRSLTEDIS